MSHMTDKGFTMILELLCDAIPAGNMLPKTYYDAKMRSFVIYVMNAT